MSAIKSCYPIKSYNLRESYQSTKTADLHQCWDNWENKEQSELAKTALHRDVNSFVRNDWSNSAMKKIKLFTLLLNNKLN